VVTLESLVPADHLLRKIDAVIDFTFIRERVAWLYCPGNNRCPQGQLLAYSTTDRIGYRHYKSDPATCRGCPLLASCTSSANKARSSPTMSGRTPETEPTPTA